MKKRSTKVPAPKTATRRQEVPEEPHGSTRNPDAWVDSDWTLGAAKTDPSGLTLSDELLRSLARQPVAVAIIETICTYVEQWGRPQESIHGIGYGIRLRDTKRPPTKIEQKLIQEVSDEIYMCGILRDEDDRYEREHLPTYLRKAAYDSLVLDRDFTEFVPDARGLPAWFRALDGATARWGRDPKTQRQYPVQIYPRELSPRVSWQPNSDGYRARIGIRRPRTILTSNNYGYPELEEGVQILHGILKGTQHNYRYFKTGISGAGVLAFANNTPRQQLRSIKQFLEDQTHGSENNRKLSVMTYPDGKPPQFISFANANMKDMEFVQFLNWLFKLFCAIFRIDPALVGFMFGNEGQTSSLSDGSPDARIKLGKEKGIWTLARHLIGGIDDYYMFPKYPELKLIAGGLQDQTEEERNKRDSEQLDFMGVNEIRATRDLRALDLEKVTNPADVPKPLLQTWLSLRSQAQAAVAGDGQDGDQEPDAQDAPDGQPKGKDTTNRTPDKQDDDADLGDWIHGDTDEEQFTKSLARLLRRTVA